MTDDAVTDGRVRRRIENRDQVIRAYVALIEEGDHDPGVEAVAARSEVSLRSIFRHFGDLDGLAGAALGDAMVRTIPVAKIPRIGEGPLDQRIENLVDARLRVFQIAARFGRVARDRYNEVPGVVDVINRVQKLLRDQAKRQFAPELAERSPADAELVLDVISLLTGFNAFDAALNFNGLDLDRIRELWIRGLTAQLTPG